MWGIRYRFGGFRKSPDDRNAQSGRKVRALAICREGPQEETSTPLAPTLLAGWRNGRKRRTLHTQTGLLACPRTAPKKTATYRSLRSSVGSAGAIGRHGFNLEIEIRRAGASAPALRCAHAVGARS